MALSTNVDFMNRLLITFFVLLAFSCSDKKEDASQYLPKATGKPGDVILVMDSMQWKGELGAEVRKVFRAVVPGLPQEEPMFNLIWVHPSRMRLLKQIRNLVYVFTLDKTTAGSKALRQDFTPESLEKIKNDTSFYRFSRKDEYAKGQEVMYLFGDTEQNLILHLKKDGQNIIDHFNAVERSRLESNMFKTRSTQGVTAFLRKEQNIELRVPVGYVLADKQDDFIWLRQIESNRDKDVFITWKPYTSEYQLLPDSVVEWRDEVAKKYLYEDPENPISYIVTERKNFAVVAKQVTLNKHYAMQIRALWRTNTTTMGGPYIGYALVDQPKGRLYYIEGFAFAPGKDKREIMRELETILWTFKTSADIAPQTN